MQLFPSKILSRLNIDNFSGQIFCIRLRAQSKCIKRMQMVGSIHDLNGVTKSGILSSFPKNYVVQFGISNHCNQNNQFNKNCEKKHLFMSYPKDIFEKYSPSYLLNRIFSWIDV